MKRRKGKKKEKKKVKDDDESDDKGKFYQNLAKILRLFERFGQ